MNFDSSLLTELRITLHNFMEDSTLLLDPLHDSIALNPPNLEVSALRLLL